MKILYAVSEAAPFSKTGGLSDVGGALPKALAETGNDIRVVLPLYESVPAKFRSQMTFLCCTEVFLAWRRQYCGGFELRCDGVIYYFIDNEYYFKRPSAYGYRDDGERFGFFSKAVVHLLSFLDWRPEIIHCNDWQTALVPVYLRCNRSFNDIKTVFTIHNIEYQGRFAKDARWELFGLPLELYNSGIMEFDGDVNLMKSAIYISDAVTTVSPTYAKELLDPYFAHGLHNIIYWNSAKLHGIINGVDVALYNPEKSPELCKNYSADNQNNKVCNKLALQKLLGLPVNEAIPVIACISRLVTHKGLDLVLEVLPRIMEENVQFVLLGSGDWAFEVRFKEAASRYPGRISANIMFSAPLSGQIYAGADIFLMPSKSEPCGLSQMIALRYGTVPVVRETGGLSDTVIPYPNENSTGFTFKNYDAYDMLFVLRKALSTCCDKTAWNALRYRGMTADFSWKKPAAEYAKLYAKLKKET